MNQPDNQSSPLDQLARDLANLPVPEGPDAKVKRRLLEMLTPTSDEPATVRQVPFWRGKTMRKIASTAALLLVAFGAASYFLPTSSVAPGVAYAAMLEQLEKVYSMSFTTRVKFQEKTKAVVRIYALNQHQVREEMLGDPQGSDGTRIFSILIHDRQAGKVLMLLTEEKIARMTSFDEETKQSTQVDIIQKFRDMRPEEASYVGEEMVEGVESLKYRYSKPDGHYMVWIDPDKQLPIKIVIDGTSSDDKTGMRFEMTDFVWDAKLDKSLFSLEVPQGYQLEEETKTLADIEREGQEGFVMILGFYVRLNENQFPDEFNALVFTSILHKLMKPGATPEEQREHHLQKMMQGLGRSDIRDSEGSPFKELCKEFGESSARGAVYLHRLIETEHWHYQGKGIQLGEADKIVAWWYPKGDEAITAHVLYGDLRIETMPVDQLPAQ